MLVWQLHLNAIKSGQTEGEEHNERENIKDKRKMAE
jgi:hypothetical protein